MGKDIKQIISEKGRKIIIIENYYNFFSVIKQFCMYDLANVQFILSARTVLYDTRILEVNDLLKIGEGESITFDINKLSKEELKQMQTLIDRNGLWGDKSNRSSSEKSQLLSGKKTGNCELQGIMLLLVNSTNIREKINNVVNNIKRMSENYFDVLVLALLIKTMSLTINANDMSKMLNMKIALDTNFIENPNVKEILEFSSGTAEFKLRSAVIAKAILQELECNETIIAVLSKVARYADPYSEIEKYENILKNIISYSHVKTFLINTKQKQAILLNYYNELKELNYYKENSFYWLQFSIACMDIERYDLAQTYLNDAYSWFRESENVVPFQVDTQQAKLYLLLIEKRKTLDIRENFLKAHELLMKPIISVKDNPVKQILNFGSYTNKTIKNQMITKGYEKEYCRCCAEAYNKVRDYLNHSRGKSDQNNLVKLSKQLLQCSIENENPI